MAKKSETMSDDLIRGLWMLGCAGVALVLLGLGAANGGEPEALMSGAKAVLLFGVIGGVWFVIRDRRR